jgi:hypothetical protein
VRADEAQAAGSKAELADKDSVGGCSVELKFT